MQKILDVCCGPRGFWYDKNNELVIFIDKRNKVFKFNHPSGNRTDKIIPDIQASFELLPFKNNCFNMVVFDPPHIIDETDTKARLRLRYGVLNSNWKSYLSNGFKECFRVLVKGGFLIFKWNEYHVPIKEILSCAEYLPLFGHRVGKQMNTHWVTFTKDEDARAENQGSHPNFVQQRKGVIT
jgi:SAM-dependent methyltransferase